MSQWIPGAQDVRVVDLLARAATQLGVTISGDDIIAFANLLSGMGDLHSLGGYLADFQRYDQLIGGLVSSSVPDLASLLNALNSANTILSEIRSVINAASQFLSGVAQRIRTWISQLQQALYQVFNSMETWVSQNLSFVSKAINGFLKWIYTTLNSALSYVYSVIQGFLQTQDMSESAQSNISAMTSAVPESSNNAWSALSDRFHQVAGEMQQQFNGFCSQYAPVSGYVKAITKWGGQVAIYGFGPFAVDAELVVAGLFLAENGIDVSCSYSIGGSIDPVEIISFAAGASILLGDIFPKEENDFGAISKVLTFVASALSATEQLKTSLDSSNYDISGVSALISDYQSASNQASSAFHQPSPDYVTTLEAIASLSKLPSIDAVNSVLESIQPCSGVLAKLTGYEQEGMVAPDLDGQAKSCQQTGQLAISDILSAQYSAVSQAASLPALASQLDPALDARHQQFIAAKQALDNLGSAASSLTSCGFMWVQPDPNGVNQVNQALQQARSQFNDGKYSEVLTTANQDEIARAKSAREACSKSAFQAELEAGGAVGIIAAISIVAVGLTIHRRRTETRENLKEARHVAEARPDLPPAEQHRERCSKCGEEVLGDARFCTNCGATLESTTAPPSHVPSGFPLPGSPQEAPSTMPATQPEIQAVAAEQKPEPKVKITSVDSLKPGTPEPPAPEVGAIPTKTTATKVAQHRKRRPGASRRKTRQSFPLKKPGKVRKKTSRKA